MPYKVYEENGEYCVHKIADDGGKGEKIACHGADKDKAAAQVRALYAKENQADFSNTSILVSNQAKRVTKSGKEFLVVHGVPAREQVMNTYLVPELDLVRSLKGWNGVPITIQHPKLNDRSANVPDPDVAIIGRFYNSAWDHEGKRMTGEYWIEIAEAEKYLEGKSILTKINDGTPLETSTGYYADDEQTAGIFDGKAYKTIHRNLLPDHIAILTNEVGACSLQDGCGVNRNAAVTNCECDCPYRKAMSNNSFPAFQEGHLPVKMLVGYSVNKGNRTAEQLDDLRNYIKENGVTDPVIIVRMNDKNIKILDGNHRVSMADELGIEQVPAQVVDDEMRPLSLHAVYAEQLHLYDQSYLNEQSLDQKIYALREAFNKQFTEGDGGIWVREIYPAYLIVDTGGELFKIAYQQSESEFAFSPRNEWKRVEMQYIEVAEQDPNNHTRATDPALMPNHKKESTMKFDELQALLAKKGLTVSANNDEFIVEETQEPSTPEITGLSAEEVTALKTLAGLAPKLNQKALDGIEKLPALIEMANNVEAERKAEKESLVAVMVSNAANTLSKDELEAMPLTVLQKIHASNSVSYAPIGSARETLFGNEDVLVVPSTWNIKPEADNG